MKKIDFTGYDVVLRSAMSGETLLRSHIVAHDIARHLIELDTPLVSQMEAFKRADPSGDGSLFV